MKELNDLNKENRKVLSKIISYGYDYNLSQLEMTTIIEDNVAMMIEAQNEGRRFISEIDNNPKLYAYEVVTGVKGIKKSSRLEKLLTFASRASLLILGVLVAMIVIFKIDGKENFDVITKADVFYNLNISLYYIVDVIAFGIGLFLLQGISLKYRAWRLYDDNKKEFVKSIYKHILAYVIVGGLYLVVALNTDYKTISSFNLLFLIVPCIIIVLIHMLHEKKDLKDNS